MALTNTQSPNVNQLLPSLATKVVWPLLSNLLSGNDITKNLSSPTGALGGTLGSILGGKPGGLAGSYLGGTLGKLASGATTGQSLTGGLPGLGIGALTSFLPSDLSPVTSQMAPLLSTMAQSVLAPSSMISTAAGPTMAGWGAVAPGTANTLSSLGSLGSVLSPILSYAGPLGMIASAVTSIIGDIAGTHDVERADRQAEENAFKQYKANQSGYENLWGQISPYLMPEGYTADKNKRGWDVVKNPKGHGVTMANLLMEKQPTWFQDLMKSPQIYNEIYATDMPLILSDSKLLNSYADPNLRSQTLNSLMKYLQNPGTTTDSGYYKSNIYRTSDYALPTWDALSPKQQDKIVSQIQTSMANTGVISSKSWEKIIKTAGGSALDPFEVLAGSKQLQIERVKQQDEEGIRQEREANSYY